MNTDLVLAASEAVFLVSFYKPVLILIPFLPWAWLVSTKLEKDAQYYHLDVRMWNAIQVIAAVIALGAMLLIPIFWIGWPIGLLLLGAPTIAYVQQRNRSVPEDERFSLTGGEGLATKLASRRQARASVSAVLTFVDANGKLRDVPLKDDPLLEVHAQLEDIIDPALRARAYRVELAVTPSGGGVFQTVDGVRYKRDPLTPEMGAKIIDYVKDLAGLDLEDRRRQQSGRFKLNWPEGVVRVNVASAGSAKGWTMRIDFDRQNRLIKPFDVLGLLPFQLEALQTLDAEHERHGIVLIGAPAGQGLTTSGYSFLNRHDAYTANIKTLELEIEARIDGVDHLEWDPSNPDIDFATNLQSILRRDPDLVLVTNGQDSETASIVSEPGMQGPLIYLSLTAANIPELIRDWVKRVGDVKQATRALRAVTCQRLIRKVCPNCRQAFQPSADQVRKLNLPSDKSIQLFRHSGKVQVKNKIENCQVCGGTGYLGQTGVYEVFMVDDAARKLLINGDLKGALAHARRHKMKYLQEAALAKAISGESTLEEIIRATAAPKSSGDPPRPQPQPATAT